MHKQTKQLLYISIPAGIFQIIDLGLHLYAEKITILRFIGIGIVMAVMALALPIRKFRLKLYYFGISSYLVLNFIWLIREAIRTSQGLTSFPILFWGFIFFTGIFFVSLIQNVKN